MKFILNIRALIGGYFTAPTPTDSELNRSDLYGTVRVFGIARRLGTSEEFGSHVKRYRVLFEVISLLIENVI